MSKKSQEVLIKDSYREFFKYFSDKPCSVNEFFDWCLSNAIFCERNDAYKEQWERLKKTILEGESVLIKKGNKKELVPFEPTIREYGRMGHGSDYFADLYEKTLNIVVKLDKTNNAAPTAILKNVTGYEKITNGEIKKKKENHILIKYTDEAENSHQAFKGFVSNYQVSHIWGHTKNPLLFTAPWNICYLPKIADPFSGHEANGDLVKIFQDKLKEEARTRFYEEIEEYNDDILNHEKIKNLKETLDSIKKSSQEEARFYEEAKAAWLPID